MATITYGAIVVPILQDFKPNDVHHIVNHSESTFLFVSDNIWENLEEEALGNLRAVFSLTDYRCLHQRDGETIQKFMRNIDTAMKKAYPKGFQKENIIYTELSNDKVMLFNYTSGTTGFSKGVMLTGNNLAGNVTFGIRTGLLKKGEKSTFFPTLGPCLWLCFRFSDRNGRGNPCHAVRQDTFSKNSDESFRGSETQPDYHRTPCNRKDIQECHTATYQ